jgi:hypothetical protein
MSNRELSRQGTLQLAIYAKVVIGGSGAGMRNSNSITTSVDLLEWSKTNDVELHGQLEILDGKNALHDCWGNRYNVVLDCDDNGVVIIGSDTNVAEYVAVWSNGPNGVNDFGANDDIGTWHKTEP